MAAPEAAAMFSELTLPQALARARAQKRIVLIDFYTSWCGPCKMLDQTTWRDASVLRWAARHVIAVKVDCDRQADLARQHRVGAFPTVLLLRPDGSEIDRLVGYRSPPGFLADVQSALAGKDAVQRAREKLDAAGANDPMARMNYARARGERTRRRSAGRIHVVLRPRA